MISLLKLYSEIKLIPKKDWKQEWEDIKEEILIKFYQIHGHADIDNETIEEETNRIFKEKFGFDYNEIKEQSTTGGGVAGATFTPGPGEQYATPYAFKKSKKKDYEVLGYKTLNPKQRFKAKTFDVVNWASNSPKYLKEIKLVSKITPEMAHKLYWELWTECPFEFEVELKSLKKKNFKKEFIIDKTFLKNRILIKAKPETLINFYQDLLKFKAKYNL